MPPTRKYVGLELGGSKSSRTAVVVLDCYPQDKKVFVSALHSRLQASDDQSGDEILLELLNKFEAKTIAVNAPLSFAPCVQCRLSCPGVEKCKVPQVAWMREEMERNKLGLPSPYTQRAADILLRGQWRKEFSEIPLEDTMGAGRAPLASRMNYLQRHIRCKTLLEVNPRLALANFQDEFEISARELRRYREIEDGVEQRTAILERINLLPRDERVAKLFLYNSDLIRLAKDLSAFDAFINALVAMYADFGLAQNAAYDESWGVLAVPVRRPRRRQILVSGDYS